MRCPCLCLLGFGDIDCVSQLPYVRYYIDDKSRFQHTREECESRRASELIIMQVCPFLSVLELFIKQTF